MQFTDAHSSLLQELFIGRARQRQNLSGVIFIQSLAQHKNVILESRVISFTV